MNCRLFNDPFNVCHMHFKRALANHSYGTLSCSLSFSLMANSNCSRFTFVSIYAVECFKLRQVSYVFVFLCERLHKKVKHERICCIRFLSLTVCLHSIFPNKPAIIWARCVCECAASINKFISWKECITRVIMDINFFRIFEI